MPQLDIKLNGRSYKIACKSGEELRLQQLADYLNGRVSTLAHQLGSNAQDTQLFMLTCFMLADELAEAKNNRSAQQAKDSVLQMPIDNSVNDNVAKRLDDLTNRIDSIIKKVAVS